MQEVIQDLGQGGKGPLNDFTGPIPLPVGQPGPPGPIGPTGPAGKYVSEDSDLWLSKIPGQVFTF